MGKRHLSQKCAYLDFDFGIATTPEQRCGMIIDNQEIVVALKGTLPQVTRCKTLFYVLQLWGSYESAAIKPKSFLLGSFPVRAPLLCDKLDPEIHTLLVLRDFKLFSLNIESKV